MSEYVLPMTAKQREVLRLIVRVHLALGEPPSERYIARRLGIDNKTLRGHLAALHSKGWLSRSNPGGAYCLHEHCLHEPPSA